MALVKCNECGKMVSDTTDKCIHCGAPVVKGEEKHESVEKHEKVEKTDKQNNNMVGFILSILASVCAFVFLVKMSLTGMALIYTLCLLASCVVFAIYNYPSKKQNSNLLLIALTALLVGALARVMQKGIGLEYLIRYALLAVASILLIYSTYKDKKQNNTLAFVFLVAVAIDAIYNFFSLNNAFIHSYTWRLYLVVEALLPAALIFTNYTRNGLNDGVKNVINKLPNVIVPIGVVAVLAILFYMLALDNGKSIIPSNMDKSDKGNSGYNVDNFDEDDNDNDNEVKDVTKVTINKEGTTVKGEYSNEELEAVISVDKIYVTGKVLPPKKRQSYYHYYEAKEGKKYLVAILNVKNTGSKSLDTDRVFSNFLGDNCSLKAVIDGKYEYSGFVVGLDKDSSKKYDLDTYYYMDALEKSKIYLIFEISSEVADKPVKINACFGDINLELDNN